MAFLNHLILDLQLQTNFKSYILTQLPKAQPIRNLRHFLNSIGRNATTTFSCTAYGRW